MTQWATVDWSDAPGGAPWKGNVFRAKDEDAARTAAHSFGYTVLRREADTDDWEVSE